MERVFRCQCGGREGRGGEGSSGGEGGWDSVLDRADW
jgi:hypothetical protein